MKKIPNGVKVISIIAYFGAFFTFLTALSIFFGVSNISMIPYIGFIGATTGLLLLAIAIIDLIIGLGLWRAQNWARVLVIFFMLFGIFGTLVSLFQGNIQAIVPLLVYSTIGYYLTYDKKVYKAFHSHH